MNKNALRAAKIRLASSLMTEEKMIKAPLSLRYTSVEDLNEIGAALGINLNLDEKIPAPTNQTSIYILDENQLQIVDENLTLLVREFHDFLETNTRSKQNVQEAYLSNMIAYGIGITKRRASDEDSVLSLKAFYKDTILKASRLKSDWADRFSEALGVDVDIERLTIPYLSSGKKANAYKAKARPISVGSAISDKTGVTGSMTLAVAAMEDLPKYNLQKDERYLLTAGHVFESAVRDETKTANSIHQPSIRDNKSAEIIAQIVHVETPVSHGQSCEVDICLAKPENMGISNAWGANGIPVSHICYPNEVIEGSRVEKMGGAGTGDAIANVTTLELDVDLFTQDGRRYRYLDQIEFGSKTPLSSPGDSGSLISHKGKALATLISGCKVRDRNEKSLNVCYGTYLNKVFDKYSLKIVY